jgi:hypothetical protein
MGLLIRYQAEVIKFRQIECLTFGFRIIKMKFYINGLIDQTS